MLAALLLDHLVMKRCKLIFAGDGSRQPTETELEFAAFQVLSFLSFSFSQIDEHTAMHVANILQVMFSSPQGVVHQEFGI